MKHRQAWQVTALHAPLAPSMFDSLTDARLVYLVRCQLSLVARHIVTIIIPLAGRSMGVRLALND